MSDGDSCGRPAYGPEEQTREKFITVTFFFVCS